MEKGPSSKETWEKEMQGMKKKKEIMEDGHLQIIENVASMLNIMRQLAEEAEKE